MYMRETITIILLGTNMASFSKQFYNLVGIPPVIPPYAYDHILCTLKDNKCCLSRVYYENLIPASPTEDHMELREGSNEDEDFEDCVDDVHRLDERVEEDQIVPGGEEEDPTVIVENEKNKELGEGEDRQ